MTHSLNKIIAAAMAVAGLGLIAGCSKEKPQTPALDTTSQMAEAMVPQNGFHPPVGHGRKDTGGGAITVDVALADSAIIVDPLHPPAVETVLAAITNLGPQPEFVYKFLPSTQATYYLYAEPSLDPTSHTTAFKVTQVMTGGATTVFLSGGFHDCADHHSIPAPAVGFKKCGRAMPAMPNKTSPPSVKTSTVKMGMLSNPLFTFLYRGIRALIQPNDTTGRDPTDPAWVACSDGCCTVNAS
jgi:hypothetical protein